MPKTEPFLMPLGGRLVESLVGSFCRAPYRGDDRLPTCSIGLGENSIVATDETSAILIGDPSPSGHVATMRKEAILEAKRSELYGDPVRFDEIERFLDEEGQEVQMPAIQNVIAKSLSGMKSIGIMTPEALAAVAKVASAAGAMEVELFQPDGDSGKNSLGFRFTFSPDSKHVNLFNTWDGFITAQGVFVVRKSEETQRTPHIPEVVEPEAEKPRRGRKPKAKGEAAESPEIQTSEDGPSIEQFSRDWNSDETQVREGFGLPSLKLLSDPPETSPLEVGEHSSGIVSTLRSFGIQGRVEKVHPGPTVSLYELTIPGGIKTSKITQLTENLQMSLAVQSVFIQAPIPGKNAIGIQVPNKSKRTVFLRELTERKAFMESPDPLTVAIGLDVCGTPVYGDLARMPHLLIAGATGAGKSIGIATLLSSLLIRNTPKDLRFVMIDPKRVELALFDQIPHLMCPVITDVKEAPGVLRAVWREMEKRYETLQKQGVRNIQSLNQKVDPENRLPYIVVVIDELADLMMQAKQEVENTIVSLAQKARAVGIHMIVATQRPSVDVITGLIKANMPSRLAFSVASQVDSRVILDQNGAEKLIGKGDALYLPVDGGTSARRVQGAYVSESEVEAVCRHWKNQASPSYLLEPASDPEADPDADDPLYSEVVQYGRERGMVSAPLLQRKFSIGFQRATRLMGKMEEAGLLGPKDGGPTRKVIG
jgi:S-DNA-T family DNA segregation ATPase FtsK/SpoIIIE